MSNFGDLNLDEDTDLLEMTELEMWRMEKKEIEQNLNRLHGVIWLITEQLADAYAAVGKLENENAEMKAEIERLKLSASDSATISSEITKREKKQRNKQKSRIEEHIAAELGRWRQEVCNNMPHQLMLINWHFLMNCSVETITKISEIKLSKIIAHFAVFARS